MRAFVFWLCIASSAFAAEQPDALRLLCWSEYVPSTVLEGFTARTGIKVDVENYASNEELLARLQAHPGFYDVIQPSGYYVRKLAEANQLEPLDTAKIPNVRHLDPRYRHLSFDPDDRFSIPWLVGTVGIVINTEKVKESVESWADVFSGKYAGRIVVVDDAREMVAWALAAIGLPITDVSDSNLQKIEPVLRKWLLQVNVFDSDSPKSALLDGRAVVGIVWSGEAALLWEADHKFRFVLPRQGAHMFVDNLAVPRGAPHRLAAEAFLDYCLIPEVSALISRAYPYTNPNLGARRLLTADQLANPASYPTGNLELPMLRNDGNTPEGVSAFVRKIRTSLNRADPK